MWQELQQQGYTGQRKSVARYLKRFKDEKPEHSTRQLVWLFMQDNAELEAEERQSLNALFGENPKLAEIYQLAQTFQRMLRKQVPESLDE